MYAVYYLTVMRLNYCEVSTMCSGAIGEGIRLAIHSSQIRVLAAMTLHLLTPVYTSVTKQYNSVPVKWR